MHYARLGDILILMLGGGTNATQARDIAKMTQVAQAAGLTREALYKALRPEAHPRFHTIQKVCRALGVKLKLTVTPA